MEFGKVLLGAILFLSGPMSANAQGSSSHYQVSSFQSGGTITGTVKWKGERPNPPKLAITKNPEICDPDSEKTRDLERLEINSDGGVANTVVYLKDVTMGKAWDLPPARQSLDQKRCRYIPHISLVPVDGNFSVQSEDPILHTVHMTGAASYNIPFPMINVIISRPMRRAGIVDLKCNAGHIWMNAVILVVEHPYYAVTDKNGDFRLTDVPPGQYEIVAWHEGWRVAREEPVLDVGTQTMTKRLFFTDPLTWQKKVTVEANGTPTVEFQISER